MKYQQFFMVCAAAGATAVVIGGAATAALAQQQNQVATIVGERAAEDRGRSMMVSYRDLNLATASDARILNRRVGGAAQVVCDSDDFKVGERAQGRCVSYAWSGARPQIALAVKRANEIAATGASSIPLVAITVVGRR